MEFLKRVGSLIMTVLHSRKYLLDLMTAISKSLPGLRAIRATLTRIHLSRFTGLLLGSLVGMPTIAIQADVITILADEPKLFKFEVNTSSLYGYAALSNPSTGSKVEVLDFPYGRAHGASLDIWSYNPLIPGGADYPSIYWPFDGFRVGKPYLTGFHGTSVQLDFSRGVYTFTYAQVPEPQQGAVALGLGLCGFAIYRRRVQSGGPLPAA